MLESFADFFSSISQEFDTIDIDKFPPNIKKEVAEGRIENKVPTLNEHNVHTSENKLLKAYLQ